MTKNTKIILAVTGVILVGGFLVVAAAAVIGIGYLASQESAINSANRSADKPAVAEKKLYKQADVDGLVRFHEWASETRFSADRRKRFESFVERDFRTDAVKARKETDDIIETHAKIRAEEKSVQEFTKAVLVAAYIEDFRKKSNDDYARFMLAVYEKRDDDTAGVSDDKSIETTDVAAEKTSYTESSMAQELVGRWQRSEGSGYIDPTGKTQYKSGAYFNYEFAPDGTVERSMDKDVLSVMQCKIAETKRATGKANVSKDTMTINFGATNHTSSNSCKAAENFQKTLPAETVAFNWRLKTEYDVTRLCIDEADGEKCYDRKD